jgi:signal transduction histidine kinase
LAEQMGGSLQLQSSQPGKGSRFVLRLPLAVS